MCFIGVIEGFIVLGIWFVGTVHTTIHINDFILYMICWYLEDINDYLCSCCIAEDLELWLNPFSKYFTTPWISSYFLHSILIEIKGTVHCSQIRWFCVGVFLKLCRHNIIIKLRHLFIDGGPCVKSLYFIQFSYISQLINLEWVDH